MVIMSFHAFATGRFIAPGFEARCVLGRGGVISASEKREGDGATPLGIWPLHRVLFRPDREPPPDTGLPCAPIRPEDGWCDAADDPHYNRQVPFPYKASAEALWRDDHAYDLLVILAHNDDPVVPGHGSAIFWHLAQPDWRATEGCVAVERAVMLRALALAKPGDFLAVVAE